MSEVALKAKTREGVRKKYSRNLRREGKIPGIYYAHNQKNINLEFDRKEVQQFLGSHTGLFDIRIDNKVTKKCILKEVQIDPVTMQFVHIDIMGVQLKEKITVSVPIKLLGEAKGVKEQGGTLAHTLHEVEISCLPLDLPESIEVDISALELGNTIHVSDLKIDNVEIVTDLDVLVASVSLTRAAMQADAEKVAEEAEGEEKAEEKEGSE